MHPSMIFHSSDAALAYLLAEWAIRLVMVVVVPLRRTPDAARSWLLLVFFLPIPGVLLYWLIGRPAFPAWRQRRFTRLRPQLELVAQRLAMSAPAPVAAGPAEARAIDLARALGGFGPIDGNRIEILDDYTGLIDRLVADIDGASDHVHLLVYIFADDATGTRVIDALARAVARGVTCRVLVDALGSRPWADRVLHRLHAAGVHAHRALPLRVGRRRRTRGDLRNHRKVFVVDGRIGYIGSQNLVDRDFRPGIVNEELVARVEGPITQQLQATFVGDWFLETDVVLEADGLYPPMMSRGGSVAQLMPSGPDYHVPGFERVLVQLVHEATARLVITTPYLIPDEALLAAMQTAVLRGVEVHLVLSMVSDQQLVSLAQRSYYDEMLRAGVLIHQYRDRLLHAKHFTVDDGIAVIGSSNVDVRSFLLNAELNMLVYDTRVVGEVTRLQQEYFTRSELVTLDAWRGRPVLRKVAENLARLVSAVL
jgi:cardiolipin synthase